jgi:hypothetical protein
MRSKEHRAFDTFDPERKQTVKKFERGPLHNGVQGSPRSFRAV